jgi:hypothetical protein
LKHDKENLRQEKNHQVRPPFKNAHGLSPSSAFGHPVQNQNAQDNGDGLPQKNQQFSQ